MHCFSSLCGLVDEVWSSPCTTVQRSPARSRIPRMEIPRLRAETPFTSCCATTQMLNEYQHPQACIIIFSLISRVWMQTQLLARGHYNAFGHSSFFVCGSQSSMPQRSLREKETTGLASRKQAPKHNFTMSIWLDHGGSESFIFTVDSLCIVIDYIMGVPYLIQARSAVLLALWIYCIECPRPSMACHYMHISWTSESVYIYQVASDSG
ncbi:hypothetical protein EV702DRAFT_689529 [Suillus placidus]|uniref:Uncharacterized protein n=1 Tax=Suillus placidus TaxID=48579 RepID=A0A9P7A205_9AGAM|nr:hypothetical protein EV702DRAFT_689529 [Suillus placidus]